MSIIYNEFYYEKNTSNKNQKTWIYIVFFPENGNQV